MMALECGGDIVVIDAGVLFPEEGMPGIDFVIPDITYLRQNSDRVRAILITHGHEDHIGALPYVLAELDVPVYASRLTHGLISVKLREHGRLKDARLNVVEPNTRFKVGRLNVEFFRVCHSIPDAMGVAVSTPLGLIVHTGDFKIDHSPVDGKRTDFASLARLAEEGVFLLMSDSTYAEVEGYTPSEQVVGEALDRVIGEAQGRVMVATFASLISRVQQVVDAAVKHGRKVTVVGRSMSNNAKMAINMGYLDVPDDTIVSINQARQLPLDEILILATGAQGEPTSALVRIANGEHQDVEVVPGDTVIISASPIPGNETLVAKTIDNLFRQGATVLHSRTAMVHVHGHGSREELKMMLSILKPTYFVPVHGEFRHLVAHAALARSTGVAESNAIVLEDGDVLELGSGEPTLADRVPSGHVFVDGNRRYSAESGLIEQRQRLSRDGVAFVTATVSKKTRRPLGAPRVVCSGVVEAIDYEEVLEIASQEAHSTLERLSSSHLEWDELKAKVAQSVSRVLHEETGMRPTVLALIEDA